MKTQNILNIIVIVIVFTFVGHAQFIGDGVRLVDNPSSVGARSQAMGNAFTGVADDFSAIYWNPAGLGLIRRPEFSFGLANFSSSNDLTFLSATNNSTNSNTILNNIGFALPFPVLRGSLVFAIGYNRTSNFTGSRSFNAYNSQSSIIPSLYSSDDSYDLAWQLGLEDTTGGGISFPINKNVQQKGNVLESGSLNQWSFAGSTEVMHNLCLGLTLAIISGSYRWDRSFTEEDINGLHQGPIAGVLRTRTDFQSLTLDEVVNQDISGWNTTFGMLYNFDDQGRIGLSIKTPSFLSIKEDDSQNGLAQFANTSESYRTTFMNDYSVTTPWIFTLGGSVNPIDWIMISADADMIDYKQLEFSNGATSEIDQKLGILNREIKDTDTGLRSTYNVRVGTEITVPKTGLQVRGGFGYRESPYVVDKGKSDFNTKTISFGLGYLFENTFLINATYSHSTFSTLHLNYTPDKNVPDSAVQTDEKIANDIVMLSIAYRF